jgi:hypothetical protein
MHDLGRREAVEGRAAGDGIGAYVFGVDQLAHLHVRELLGKADSIESIACWAEDRADLSGTFLETFQVVLGVVKDDAAIGVIDAVIEIVTKLAAADGLADDLGDGCGRGGDQEPPRLSKDFDRFGEKSVQLGVNHLRESPERRDRLVVVGGKTTADVEELEIEATRLGLRQDPRGQVQRLAVVLWVRALAADVEAQPLDLQLVIVSEGNQVHSLAGQGTELA